MLCVQRCSFDLKAIHPSLHAWLAQLYRDVVVYVWKLCWQLEKTFIRDSYIVLWSHVCFHLGLFHLVRKWQWNCINSKFHVISHIYTIYIHICMDIFTEYGYIDADILKTTLKYNLFHNIIYKKLYWSTINLSSNHFFLHRRV